jgi:Uma2 family endonuclease
MIGMVTLPPGLLEAPELALYEHEIRARLEDEQRRREKFRDEMLPDVKAEFINGEIIVHSPATVQHNLVRKRLVVLLDTHISIRRLGVLLDEKALIALTRNDYEPDINFFSQEKASQLAPQQVVLPAPDFIVEVLSSSTEHRDRGVKFRDYAAHDVMEYWLVDPISEIIEQYENVDGHYKLLLKLNTGSIASRVITGFEVPIRAIFDEQEHLAALRRLLASS